MLHFFLLFTYKKSMSLQYNHVNMAKENKSFVH